MNADVTVRNNTESSCYDAILGDRVVGMIIYERRGDRMVIRHSIVDPEFRGQGIAGTLARAALDDLLARGLTLTNYCGFIADFIRRNPGYARLIDARQPGRAVVA